MINENVEKLIHMNNRLSLVLGYSMGFLLDYSPTDSSDKKKYEWLMTALENIFYLDKPLPPMPEI